MTGEVKRYYATSPYSGNEPELVVTWADHLAVVEGLRADAERYRWLRNQTATQTPYVLSGDDPWLCGPHLDAAIDEAMRGGHDP